MLENNFNFYGYSHETYKSCTSQIRQANKKQLIILNTWFLIINILYLVFSCFNLFGVSRQYIWFYAVYVGDAAVLGLIIKCFPRFSERFSALLAYINVMTLFSYGILTSVMYPYMPAVMHHILAILIALMYIGNMANSFFLTVVGVSVFLISSFKYKTFSIAYYDSYNALIVGVLSIGLHYMFQRLRMQQFVLFQKDKEIQHELQIKSSFDGLTGLMNRGFFFSFAENVIGKRFNRYLALCLIDLDGFKEINDTLGHQMGDKVIQMTGKIILETMGIGFGTTKVISEWDPADNFPLAGRLGGDEFIILVRGKESKEEVQALMQELLSRLNAVRLDGIQGIRASIGIFSMAPEDRDIDAAYRRVDEALYTSKRTGKNQICFAGQDTRQGV